MMKRTLILGLMLCLMALPVWAEGSVEFAQKAVDQFAQQKTKGLQVQWRGLGRVAGKVLQVQLVNEGDTPLEVHFVPGMVLRDPQGRWEPMMLEGVTVLKLAPGQSKKKTLRGYGLDHSMASPSGTQLGYEFTSSDAYESAVKTLWAGLRLEKNGKIKPALSALQYRTIVLQRAIWASLGEPNPGTEEKLRLDLLEDTRAGGHSFSEEKVEWLAKRIWKDVETVRAAAKREA